MDGCEIDETGVTGLPVVLIPDQSVPVDQEHQARGGQRPRVLGGHVVRDLGRKLNQSTLH